MPGTGLGASTPIIPFRSYSKPAIWVLVIVTFEEEDIETE